MTARGPDVSSHQGVVDWHAVKAAGNTFAWTKATGGSWYKNPTLSTNWDGMRNAGLVRGAYHYAFESSGDPHPRRGPDAEADYFLQAMLALGLHEGDMLALDIEEGPDDVDLADWALRWLRRVEARVGFRPLVYSGAWFTDPRGFGRVPALAGYPLWQAAYADELPSPAAPWPMVAFWQFTDKASVPGIATPCDLNELTTSAGSIAFYGKPSGVVDVVLPPPRPRPGTTPRITRSLRTTTWSCARRQPAGVSGVRAPAERGVARKFDARRRVVTTEYGLMDASGRGLARWLTDEYGGFRYTARTTGATFDDVAHEARREDTRP